VGGAQIQKRGDAAGRGGAHGSCQHKEFLRRHSENKTQWAGEKGPERGPPTKGGRAPV